MSDSISGPFVTFGRAAQSWSRVITPAVFLDRDGVLNDVVVRDGAISSPINPSEFRVGDEASIETEKLKQLGFALIVISNQPDIARGIISRSEVESMNQVLLDTLPLLAVYYCPHDNPDGCRCRKPLPGLIEAAAGDFNLDRGNSFLIGDRWVDIRAGHAAGVTTILLEKSYSFAETGAGPPPSDLHPDFRGKSLEECVAFIKSKCVNLDGR